MRGFRLSIRAKLTLILALLSAPVAVLGWFWVSAALSDLSDAARARVGLERIAPVWRELARQGRMGVEDLWDATDKDVRAEIAAAVEDDPRGAAEFERLVDPARSRAVRLDAGRRLIAHLAARYNLDAERDAETAYLATLIIEDLPELILHAQAVGAAGSAGEEPLDRAALLQGLGRIRLGVAEDRRDRSTAAGVSGWDEPSAHRFAAGPVCGGVL